METSCEARYLAVIAADTIGIVSPGSQPTPVFRRPTAVDTTDNPASAIGMAGFDSFQTRKPSALRSGGKDGCCRWPADRSAIKLVGRNPQVYYCVG